MIGEMFLKGIGIGCLVVGAGMVLVLALPVFAVMCKLISMVFGKRKGDAT